MASKNENKIKQTSKDLSLTEISSGGGSVF